MFKPLPMQRVQLCLLMDDAPQASLLLANYGNFDPEFCDTAAEQFPELPGTVYRAVYDRARAHLDKILAHYEISAPSGVDAPMQPVDPPQLTEAASWLKSVWDKCSAEQEHMRKLREEYRRTAQLLRMLEQFMDLSVDLTLLQKKNALLDVRIGTLPRANLPRFEEALGLAGYVAIRFYSNEEQVHLILAGASGQAREIDRVLQAASWHVMEIPAEFNGRPDEVRQELNARMSQLEGQQGQQDALRRAEAAQENLHKRLLDTASLLARAAPYAELAELLHGHGSLATVAGWVPSDQLPGLKRMLAENFGNRYALHVRDPEAGELPHVPSAIRHHRWLQPFARLVLNYGVPRYGEIDPTVLFAASFVLMFGMMFGDIGHGSIIALTGFLLRRRLGQYAALAVAIGISSIAFGLSYGSLFGFEHLFPALWMAPLSDPMRMLGVALGWGIGFILLATLLMIRNRIAAGRLRDALLDSHGGAGLLMYLGLLGAGWHYASGGGVDIIALLAIAIAFAAMFAHAWHGSRGAATSERLLVAIMEILETVMAYVSNTLSFLRLAAFSLNHVALAVAIFTVADMLQTTGYWITVVLGNLFILVLEGGIVAIQTLRLEYYEGFSRFFGGDGRPFRPLVLGNR